MRLNHQMHNEFSIGTSQRLGLHLSLLESFFLVQHCGFSRGQTLVGECTLQVQKLALPLA
jgi:hypothetical protein